jgi:hypothetical protein
MKRALKKIDKLTMGGNSKEAAGKLNLTVNRILAKYYIRTRCIQVIME